MTELSQLLHRVVYVNNFEIRLNHSVSYYVKIPPG